VHLVIVVSAGGYSITEPLAVCLAILAALAALPAWLCGSILKKHAEKDGGAGSDWVPLSLLPYGLSRFQHRHKIAVVWGYLFSNLLLAGAIVALVYVLRQGKS
jgi:hypothetical protein